MESRTHPSVPAVLPLLALVGLVMALVLLSSPALGDVYKWVDKYGKTHFGDRPPDAKSAEKVKIKPPPTEAQRREAQARADELIKRQSKEAHVKETLNAERQSAEHKQAMADNERSQRCRAAQRNLQILGMGRPVYYTNEDGEEVYVSDNEREMQKKEAQSDVDKYCGS